MVIGLFHRTGDEFAGRIKTLTVNVEVRLLVVVGAQGGSAPSHTVVAHDVEIGAAWPKVRGDFSVLNVRIDDPVFPVPLAAILAARADGGYVLRWVRPRWRS